MESTVAKGMCPMGHGIDIHWCCSSFQVDQLTDRLKRSLAEMENVRTRSTREVENAKKFGSQVRYGGGHVRGIV